MTAGHIAGAAFRVPEHSVSVRQLWEERRPRRGAHGSTALALPKLDAITLDEVEAVPVCGDEAEGTLACAAIEELLCRRGITGREVGLIVDFSTVSRASNGLSLCYRVQAQLRANRALTLAIGNGSCIALQLALQTATVFLSCHPELEFAVLFSEDRVRGQRLQPPANVLGDGASALILERGRGRLTLVDTTHVSVGELAHVLGIHHWQEANFDVGEFEQRIVPLYYRMTHEVVSTLLRKHGLTLDDVGLILYQNMSANDFRGLSGALSVPLDRIYTGGLKGRGHIFGADLVINLADALQAGMLAPGTRVLLISSGAGFCWGASLVEA